jgi:hypothetical protein
VVTKTEVLQKRLKRSLITFWILLTINAIILLFIFIIILRDELPLNNNLDTLLTIFYYIVKFTWSATLFFLLYSSYLKKKLTEMSKQNGERDL